MLAGKVITDVERLCLLWATGLARAYITNTYVTQLSPFQMVNLSSNHLRKFKLVWAWIDLMQLALSGIIWSAIYSSKLQDLCWTCIYLVVLCTKSSWQHQGCPAYKRFFAMPPAICSVFSLYSLFLFLHMITHPWLSIAAAMHVLVVNFIPLTHQGCTLQSTSLLAVHFLTKHYLSLFI